MQRMNSVLKGSWIFGLWNDSASTRVDIIDKDELFRDVMLPRTESSTNHFNGRNDYCLIVSASYLQRIRLDSGGLLQQMQLPHL